MGQLTKKALDTAREKILQKHQAEIEALAAVSVIEERRDKIATERADALEKINKRYDKEDADLDLDLAVAVSDARGSMSAKTVASTLGVSVARQKELLALITEDSGDNGAEPVAEVATDRGDDSASDNSAV